MNSPLVCGSMRMALAIAWLGWPILPGGCGPAPLDLPPQVQQSLAKVRTVAVLPFVDAPGDQGKGSGQVVVTPTIVALHQCRGLTIIERQRLDAIANELDLKLSGQVDLKDATRLGKLAGADAIVLGEVTQYEAQQEYSHMAVDIFSGGGTEHIHRVGLAVRLVDVNTNCIIDAGMGQGVSKGSKGGFSKAAEEAALDAIRKWKQFYEQQSPNPR